MNLANGPIIFTYFAESELSTSTIQYYKKPDTLRYAIFHGIFEIGGGGTFLYWKNHALCVTYFYGKTMNFSLRFYI